MYINNLNLEIDDKNVILGHCFGVAFVPRASGDNHICLMFLTKDGGNWNQSNVPHSSYWIFDILRVMECASNWLKNEAIPSKDGFGYEFK